MIYFPSPVPKRQFHLMGKRYLKELVVKIKKDKLYFPYSILVSFITSPTLSFVTHFTQYHAPQQQSIMIILVEYSIFPTPVSGKSNPPKKNIKKPSTAEAFPEFSRSKSNANVVELGKINPKKVKNRKRKISTIHTDGLAIKAIAVNILMPRNPFTPNNKAFCAVLKPETAKLPAIMPKALTAKHKLYLMGDNPKCS